MTLVCGLFDSANSQKLVSMNNPCIAVTCEWLMEAGGVDYMFDPASSQALVSKDI